MVDGDTGQGGAAAPTAAGETLRAAREAQGLTLDDVSARTRVPLRHLQAIELGDYKGLPSPTYAVGFGRAYARAVGLSDAAVARQVRAEVDRLGPRKPEYVPFEMADPARVPSRGLTIVSLGLALAIMVLGGLWFASTRFQPGAATSRPSAPDAVVAAIPAVPSPARAAPTGGQVTLAATDELWLRVYDGDDTLFIGTMKAGDRFDVPATARDPQVNVGRPDKLAVTLNGSAVPPLGDGSRPIKDVPVGGAAIARRLSGAPDPLSTPGAPEPVPTVEPGPSNASAPPAFAPVPPARTNASRPRRALTETQRANLESAARVRRQTGR